MNEATSLSEHYESSKIEKAIPLDKDFMIKKIDDRVYGFLRIKSYKGINLKGEEVYFAYKNGILDEISSALRINKRSVRNKIDNMLKAKYLTKSVVRDLNGKGTIECYILENASLFQKVEEETLKELVYNTQEHVIKTYAYILDKYLFRLNIGDRYRFSERELILECLGVKFPKSIDYEIMMSCISMLQRLGLLVLSDKKYKKFSDKTGKCTFYFEVLKVNTKLPSKEVLSKMFLNKVE